MSRFNEMITSARALLDEAEDSHKNGDTVSVTLGFLGATENCTTLSHTNTPDDGMVLVLSLLASLGDSGKDTIMAIAALLSSSEEFDHRAMKALMASVDKKVEEFGYSSEYAKLLESSEEII